jgi:predicted HAD superfamily phosphohydrolase YqeG
LAGKTRSVSRAVGELNVIFPKKELNPIKEEKVKAVLFDLFETLVSQYDPDFNQKKLTSIHPTFVI